MEITTKQKINQNLESIEKRILLIALSDPEKYSEFSSRLSKIQESFIGLSDLRLETQKISLIGEISKLEDDFSAYMDGYDQNDITSLVTKGKVESGRGKLRAYRFNLYTSIFDDLKKLDTIKIDQLTQLNKQWKIDKASSDYQFSPVEISAIDQELADTFLEYQIKFLQVNGTMPQEKITDFVDLIEYQASIQRKLTHHLKSNDITPMDKLELDSLKNNPDLKNVLKSPTLFQALTGKKHFLTPNEINTILGEPNEKNEIPTASTLEKNTETKIEGHTEKNTELIPVKISKQKIKNNYVICVAEMPNKIFNRKGTHKKNFKIKLDTLDPNIISIPHKYREYVSSVILPEGLKKIPEATFKGCINLKEIYLPDSIEKIEESAFKNAYRLQKINFPQNLKSIGSKAFYQCKKIETVNLPECLETIGNSAFAMCSRIESINLPESLRTIDDCAFVNCGSLKEIKLPSQLSYFGEAVFRHCIKLEKFDCSNNLEVIPPSTFFNCIKLRDIKFSKNLLRIGCGAFNSCNALTYLNLPDTLERIDSSAFENCNNLRPVKLPKTLKHLGYKVFPLEVQILNENEIQKSNSNSNRNLRNSDYSEPSL